MNERIERVLNHFEEWKIDLLIIDNPLDLFYLTGQEVSCGRLCIAKEGVTLYVDGRYFSAVKKSTPLTVALLTKETVYPEVAGRRVGFDSLFTTYETYEKLSTLNGLLTPIEGPIRSIRAIKEGSEIALLKEAARLGSEGYDFVLTQLKEGVTEEEVANELEIFWRRRGGERVAFAPHIAFGENSAYPHYHSGNTRLTRGDCVLIDIGVVRKRYHSDMTRVVFFGGVNERLKKIYQIVQLAHRQALLLCKPGTAIAALDHAARSLIEESGYGENFTHSLGHGVGLAIHEEPFVRKTREGVLQEGMVLTIEPGIYIEGLGGIRLEDTIVITSDGYENFTNRSMDLLVL